jgi:hypothetical protein
MKTFPYFVAAALASFLVTYGVFAASSDDQGIEHWAAVQASAVAAFTDARD